MNRGEWILVAIVILLVVAIHLDHSYRESKLSSKTYTISAGELGTYKGATYVESRRNWISFKDSNGKDVVIKGQFTYTEE